MELIIFQQILTFIITNLQWSEIHFTCKKTYLLTVGNLGLQYTQSAKYENTV